MMQMDVSEEFSFEDTDSETSEGRNSEQPAQPDGRALRLLEAVLFSATEPMSVEALAERLPEGIDLRALLKALQADYAERGVHLRKIENRWAFRTAEDLAAEMRVQRKVARKM